MSLKRNILLLAALIITGAAIHYIFFTHNEFVPNVVKKSTVNTEGLKPDPIFTSCLAEATSTSALRNVFSQFYCVFGINAPMPQETSDPESYFTVGLSVPGSESSKSIEDPSYVYAPTPGHWVMDHEKIEKMVSIYHDFFIRDGFERNSETYANNYQGEVIYNASYSKDTIRCLITLTPTYNDFAGITCTQE